MKLISNIEHCLPLLQDAFCLSVVHRRRREQAQAGMPVLLVIPTKKSLTESTTVFEASETVRELRPILQRAELAFRIRVVVRNMRTAVCFGHPQIGQQEGHRFGGHGGAAIGMQCELARTNPLLLATLLDQSFREFGAFP